MLDTRHYLFYSVNITDGNIILDEGETAHAVSVLRVKEGQQIQITDGNGSIYECKCEQRLKNSLSCKTLTKKSVSRTNPRLTLLLGIPDKEPFETVLEQVTAIGVFRIIPLVMDHCRKPWWENWDKIQKRFISKMIVSMKQSLYPYMPQLDRPTRLPEIIDTCPKPLIAADQNGETLRDDILTSQSQICCLIGPPGGLSIEEENLLESHKALTVKIAPHRLRTELAAAVLCSRIMASFL
ncbi:MAG: 16S rRNA (uracil(1498)-N(3))-methyltransferase [Chitinispirillales bacterium]|jgi:16S rRNA (uracil1498-N3)-methyltransferase|nr:16S rRNA (uracil(1498)-N(3))-methyltransferase [Chitinispirillales bacterium]